MNARIVPMAQVQQLVGNQELPSADLATMPGRMTKHGQETEVAGCWLTSG